jgi:hypothetical protein
MPLQERILEFLLSVDDVAERNALLLEAFTPLSVCLYPPQVTTGLACASHLAW